MRYPGGKGGAGVFQTIINQFPPHRVYIEPFATCTTTGCAATTTARQLAAGSSPRTCAVNQAEGAR